jgi:hypothetical protein
MPLRARGVTQGTQHTRPVQSGRCRIWPVSVCVSQWEPTKLEEARHTPLVAERFHDSCNAYGSVLKMIISDASFVHGNQVVVQFPIFSQSFASMTGVIQNGSAQGGVNETTMTIETYIATAKRTTLSHCVWSRL